MDDKTIMLIQEISRISDKLNDTRVTQEEKLTLTALKKEKIEEFRNLCKIYLEKTESKSKSKSKFESEYTPETREEEIKRQKSQIEYIKEVIEQCKKENNLPLLNSMVILLERQKENLKFLVIPLDTPEVYRDFLGYSHFKKSSKEPR